MIIQAIKTRFAPSPTGLMHLGNVRAALVNYLFAHQQNGSFILRIEDTDAQRNFDFQGTQIIKDLAWLGIEYDEGPGKPGLVGPYYQSERTSIYQEHLARLIEAKKVYRCFCTEAELEQSRKQQLKLKKPPRYLRVCAHLSSEQIQTKLDTFTPYIWRMRLDHDLSFDIHDIARGTIHFDLIHFSDFPVTRQDGSFTFLFANAVDDMTMKITHVFRGEDHLSNTALQAALFHAFDIPLPIYWHMPIICNTQGKKLSKRDFGFSLTDLQKAGFLPEAICNYLGIIGGGVFEREILSLQELVTAVRFDTISAAGRVTYDVEKLRWVNHKWIDMCDPERLAELTLPFLQERYPVVNTKEKSELVSLLQIIKTDMITLADAPQVTHFYFVEPAITLGDMSQTFGSYLVPVQETVTAQLDKLATVADFIDALKGAAKQQAIPIKYFYWFVRLALTGQQDGPSIHDIVTMLGVETARQRLERFQIC